MQSSIFITGTDGGLGRALAHRFLHADWRVFGGRYAATPSGEDTAAADDRFTAIPLDVTDLDSVRAAAQAVAELTDSLDVVINNAGIFAAGDSDAMLADLDFDAVMRTFDVNACGPLRVVQQFLPLLQAGATKLLVNISSEAGSIADCHRVHQFGYCMSKTALNIQSRILENFLKPSGFRIVAVHPGGMRTGMLPACDRGPEEAAAGIFEIVRDPDIANGKMYVQWDGTPLPF